ncbi:hypothetical protein BH09ACT4_BH09ACT4_16730 [soil metagenome]
MPSNTFQREIHVAVPSEINLWVALTALVNRLDSALKEVRPLGHRRSVTIWATDGSYMERKTVEATHAAMTASGLHPDWCVARAEAGRRGRYEIFATGDGSEGFKLRVNVSSAQKLNADALAATVRDFGSDLEADPKRISDMEIARTKKIRSRKESKRSWLADHGASLGVNLLSAVVGGVVATLIIVFVFGIR